MTVHMVMAPTPSSDAQSDAKDVVFIKDGFNWPAFFLAVPWLLIRGRWLVLVGYLIVAIVVAGLGALIGGLRTIVGRIALSLLFALEANGLRRWTLEQRGWTFIGVAAGANRDEYEARFFSDWSGPVEVLPQTPSTSGTPARTPVFRAATPSDEVIGLFPEATL
ncbi:DUF2628 domain-containing protein [Breoghania sp.]|uniref:DUF2628 domain-containing protein n=1 Tax=Breoghania sp. TaxID=2065378 RepID=UPI00262F0736|nr:DUF2628 domain-containing protein [Breoghania sp.]MDJ0930373.1 DUF2628 domain-containing protein [Breoghania sp.]